jgi:hypothetical protein
MVHLRRTVREAGVLAHSEPTVSGTDIGFFLHFYADAYRVRLPFKTLLFPLSPAASAVSRQSA